MIAFLLAVAALAAAPPAEPKAGEARSCANPYHQADSDRRATVRRLDQLPPGRLELTVLRAFDGCPEPVVLREGIGAGPAIERRRRR